MAREFAKSFYKSAAWRKCRTAYIKQRIMIDGGMCETCGTRPGKIVHHKVWITPDNINNPDVTLNLDNLKYDCQECHNKETENETKPRYIFDESGQPILPPEK